MKTADGVEITAGMQLFGVPHEASTIRPLTVDRVALGPPGDVAYEVDDGEGWGSACLYADANNARLACADNMEAKAAKFERFAKAFRATAAAIRTGKRG